MIVQNVLVINGIQFTKTTSDENRYVERDGMKFDVAYDPTEYGLVYTEGEIIPDDESADKAEAYDILMGVQE